MAATKKDGTPRAAKTKRTPSMKLAVIDKRIARHALAMKNLSDLRASIVEATKAKAIAMLAEAGMTMEAVG